MSLPNDTTISWSLQSLVVLDVDVSTKKYIFAISVDLESVVCIKALEFPGNNSTVFDFWHFKKIRNEAEGIKTIACRENKLKDETDNGP